MADIIWLIPSFFSIALIYSMVGLGGGSSYLALLALSGIAYTSYAPLALIAAVGLESVIKHFTKKIQIQLLFLIPIVIYLFIILIRISPYYLDYFNILTGGTYLVNKYNIFQQGWWGQGIREATLYLADHSESKSTVGLAVIPLEVVPQILHLKMEGYKKEKQYNFVIVSHYNIIREGFDDSQIKKNYNPIYFVKADGAVLVILYKHK